MCEELHMKITALVIWEAEYDEYDAVIQARQQLENILPIGYTIKNVRVDPKPKKHQLKIIGEFGLSEIFDKVSDYDKRMEFLVNGKVYHVRMNSQRYFVFKENSRCVACGIEGKKFLLEQHPNDKTPHFNLYAIENEQMVLMTKDHIQARAVGGENIQKNYQTMCQICNNLKSHYNLDNIAVNELRTIYNENKDTMPRKQLSVLMDQKRSDLAKPWETDLQT